MLNKLSKLLKNIANRKLSRSSLDFEPTRLWVYEVARRRYFIVYCSALTWPIFNQLFSAISVVVKFWSMVGISNYFVPSCFVLVNLWFLSEF